MTEPRRVVRAPAADIQRVLEQRTARLGPVFAPVQHVEGAHVWAASGLVGWPGSSPTSVFAQSGLRDAFADLRDKTPDPRDWVTTVAGAMKGR